MPIAVRCPNQACGRLVRVSASLRGKRIQCPACGGGLKIPAPKVGEPQPVGLDDTPPDLEAIPENPIPSTSASSTAPPSRMGDRVADGAASVTSALGPVIKLVAAFALLAGLVMLGRYLFPLLSADKPIASINPDALSAEEDAARQREADRLAKLTPLDEESRARITDAIDSGDFAAARRLMDTLHAGGTVRGEDLRSLDVAYQAALAARLDDHYERAAGHAESKRWDEARAELAKVELVASGEARSPRYRDAERTLGTAEAADLLEQSKAAAERRDHAAAQALAERARQLNATNPAIRTWMSELATLKGAGIKVQFGRRVAEVFFDGKRIGDSTEEIWQLPVKRRFRLRIRAPGFVPREYRLTLKPRERKELPVELAPAAPDALWVACLLDTDAARWLACRALPSDDPDVGDYAESLKARCLGAKVNDKKRSVWRVRMADGATHDALDYSVLGKTVRFVDLVSGETVRTTTDAVRDARKLDLDEGASRWISATRARAEAALNACEALDALAGFVEYFPDNMDAAVRAWGAVLTTTCEAVAQTASCKKHDPKVTRDNMDLGRRLDAEIAAWQRAGLSAPEVLLDQKKRRR